MRLKKFILFACLTAYVCTLHAQDYVKAIARPGETIQSFLNWYELDQYDCNFKKFYELNTLKEGAKLKPNKLYILPLRLYKYNKVSIRSTLKDDDMDKALRIKDFNEKMLELNLMATNFIFNGNLWVPIHEIDCKKAAPYVAPKPTEPAPITEKPTASAKNLFGKNVKIEVLNNKLKGAVYYLVAGHGGPDSGALGFRNDHQLCEDEYAYDVTLRLAKYLMEQGATVYMITRDNNDGIRSGDYLKCDADETCWPNLRIPLNHSRRLSQRSGAINKLYEKHKKQGAAYQCAMMVHIDSRHKTHQTDLFFYHHPDSKAGKISANTIKSTIKAEYKKHQPNREYTGTVTARDLHMLRETKPKAIYVELGNIQHANDQQRFIKEGNRKAVAKWLGKGLYNDFMNFKGKK